MKPTTQFCLSKLRLLSGQDFFQKDEIVLGYLARRIQAVAESEQHVERMIETWVSRTRLMLHPSDVPALANETSSHPGLPEGCEICKGETYITIEKNGEYFASRCSCARGQALTAMDRAPQKTEKRAA